jgi:PhnB protein
MAGSEPFFFAPQLFVPNGVRDLSFYTNAFGAIELMLLKNDDGSIHVSELSIEGAIFHVHEEKRHAGLSSPSSINHTTALIGLFVTDVDAITKKAISAGASIISEPYSCDYGYRQAEIKDPFGHIWLIESKI